MTDMSHTMRITADLAKAKQAAAKLKASPPSVAEIEKDPKHFLQQLGVDVDDHTASIIKNRLAKRPQQAPTPASIVHIDG
jgi:hypothetical protein